MHRLILWTTAIAVAALNGCAASRSIEAAAASDAQRRADIQVALDRHRAESDAIRERQTQQEREAREAADARRAAVFAPVEARVEQWKLERDQAVQDARDAFTEWQLSAQCQEHDSQAVLARILRLREYVHTEVHGGAPSITGSTARDIHAPLTFAFADECLQRRHLSTADAAYRSLIEFYVGPAYSGIRDRARLGIDDVRDARVMVRVEPE